MLDPEREFEYEQKCEHIAMEIEILILDGILAALERLNRNLQCDDTQNQKPSSDIEPF